MMASSSDHSSSRIMMMKMAAATTFGRVPLVQAKAGESVVVNGAETDSIVTKATKYYVVEIAAVLALISGSLSFYYVVGGFVDFMSLCVVLLAPVLTVQGQRLRQLGTFRQQHNLLRNNISKLSSENSKLSQSVSKLTIETTKLDQVQRDLNSLATKSGQSVDQLVSMVEENGKIHKEILENLQAQVLQQIMTAVVNSDRDRNFIVSAKEVNALLLRLKNLPGIDVDEAAFYAHIKSDKGELTIADVCAIARLLKDETAAAAAEQLRNLSTKVVMEQASDKIQAGLQQLNNKRASIFRFRPKDLLKGPKRR